MSRRPACRRVVLVGLPEAAVKESTHRVERAIVNSGFQRPQNRVVINLAPADLPKDAASFDLPIAMGMLAGSGQIGVRAAGRICRGGRIGPRRHHPPGPGRRCRWPWPPPRSRACAACWCPRPARPKRPWSKGIEVIPIASLAQAVAFLSGEIEIEPQPSRLDDLFRDLGGLRGRFLRRPRPGDGQAGA